MSEKTAIKTTYKAQLSVFVVLNVALFWGVVVLGTGINDVVETVKQLSISDSLYVVLAPIIVLILGGLLSADAKTRWAFLRYRDALPACRAFSIYLNSDPRIDKESLLLQWGEYPSDPTKQNILWYKMYKSVEEDLRIEESHRNWLFTRDLIGYSVIFFFVLGTATILSHKEIVWWYIVVLLVQYGILVLAAQNYGKRFVTNVMTLVSHKEI